MNRDVIIAGGGLAGSLAALALARTRPDLNFLLVEGARSFGGNHIWSFFDEDVAAADRWLVDPLVTRSWPQHEVRFPKRQRQLGFGYNSIRSHQLDHVVRTRLAPERYRTGSPVREVGATHILLDGGERVEALAVIDARGPSDFLSLDLGWQKFLGRTYRVAPGDVVDRPIIMDAMVAQHDGYRFVYTLPFATDEIMVEDTYYADTPDLDVPMLRQRVDSYVAAGGYRTQAVLAEETGVLPVVLGGEVDDLWRKSGGAAQLGLRGGFFHPTTGYSLPDAVRNAILLAGTRDLSAPALHDLFLRRARKLWQERGFYRVLNRMLFRAAGPALRYRVLEHFYRLPEPVIARFYAAEATSFDKLRILTGRPPVPVGRALRAMRSKAA